MDSLVHGQVVSTDMQKIVIAIEDEAQWAGCGLKESCSNKTLTLNKSEVDYPAAKGERIQVIYRKLLQTSLFLYLFPLLAFFSGIALSAVFFPEASEAVQFLAGFVSLAVALILVHLFGKQLNQKDYKIEIKPVK